MQNIQWKFKVFDCFPSELQEKLNSLGAEGWRLHTSEPVPTWGTLGSGEVRWHVVMDMLISPDEEPHDYMDNDDAMAMKG